MMVQVFAVFDTKIGSYSQPFFMPTVPSAKRAFASACSDPSTNLNKHPADYSLFHLADFDDETGVFTSRPPENLGLASFFLQGA